MRRVLNTLLFFPAEPFIHRGILYGSEPLRRRRLYVCGARISSDSYQGWRLRRSKGRALPLAWDVSSWPPRRIPANPLNSAAALFAAFTPHDYLAAFSVPCEQRQRPLERFRIRFGLRCRRCFRCWTGVDFRAAAASLAPVACRPTAPALPSDARFVCPVPQQFLYPIAASWNQAKSAPLFGGGADSVLSYGYMGRDTLHPGSDVAV